jgi:CubicO group peptidase (beta-lactamase class C family)
LAVAEGRFGLEDKVTGFFRDELPDSVGQNLAAMRVKDLLMMGAGHAGDSLFGGNFTVKDPNWARSVLARPVEYFPSTHFTYNNGATYLCSAIVQKTTGQTVLGFLTPRLFKPLGIAGADWELNPQGINPGAWGLRVKTEDIAKLGQLYLQKGQWHGKQVLPETWVDEATRVQIQNATDPDPTKNQNNDWAQGYGYQFWRCRHGAYRGDGAYGQYCIVMPQQEAVIAITSETPDMQAVLNQVWTHILPSLGGHGAEQGSASSTALKRKLAGLSLAHPTGTKHSPVAATWNHKVAKFETNALGIQSAAFSFDRNVCRVTLTDSNGLHAIEAGYRAWRTGQSRLPVQSLHLALAAEPGVLNVSSSAAWTDERTLTIRMQFVETAHFQNLTFRFEGNQVKLEFTRSISVVFQGSKDPRPVLVGTLT